MILFLWNKIMTSDELIRTTYFHFPMIGQNRSEITEFVDILMNLKPKNIMEIGTQWGATFFIWCNIAEGMKISMDMSDGIHGGLPKKICSDRNKSFYNSFMNSHMFEMDSHLPEAKSTIKALLRDDMLDFLFIDGDHTYEGVGLDFSMYKEFVRPGGIIAFHDINPMEFDPSCGVHKFWNKLSGYQKHEINHKLSWSKENPVMGGIGYIYA